MGTPHSQLPGHIKQLVTMGLLSLDIAEKSVKKAHAEKTPVMEWFIQHQIVTPRDMVLATSVEYGITAVDLDSIDILPQVADLISDDQKQRLHLLPIHRYGNHLIVALADPVYLPNLDDVKFATNLKPEPVFVEFDKLQIYLASGGGFNSPMNQSGMAVSSEAITQNMALDTKELKKIRTKVKKSKSSPSSTSSLHTPSIPRFRTFISSRMRKTCASVTGSMAC